MWIVQIIYSANGEQSAYHPEPFYNVHDAQEFIDTEEKGNDFVEGRIYNLDKNPHLIIHLKN